MTNPKDETLINLAEKGGNDADLLLLDEIHKIDSKIDAITAPIADKVTAIESRPLPSPLSVEVKGAELVTIKGDKGDKGDTGEQGAQGASGKDGTDGKNGTNGLNGLDGIDGKDGANGQDGVNGKDGSPDTPEQVRDKLETLQDDNRLDVSAIKGLDDKLKGVSKPTYSVFGGRSGSNVVYFDLSSQLNGSTKTFFLGTHFGIIAVFGSSTPFVFRPTVDYTESGKNIVFTSGVDAQSMLAGGQTLIVLCKK